MAPRNIPAQWSSDCCFGQEVWAWNWSGYLYACTHFFPASSGNVYRENQCPKSSNESYDCNKKGFLIAKENARSPMAICQTEKKAWTSTCWWPWPCRKIEAQRQCHFQPEHFKPGTYRRYRPCCQGLLLGGLSPSQGARLFIHYNLFSFFFFFFFFLNNKTQS